MGYIMVKQLFANGKSSYNDFKIYIKERNPSIPAKRKNIKTVPGMHGAYDFSDLYGEVIYENRTIEYKFDVTGWDIEDLDYERRRVMDWLLNINQTEIARNQEIYLEYPCYHMLSLMVKRLISKKSDKP